jgi:hypothetical protein
MRQTLGEMRNAPFWLAIAASLSMPSGRIFESPTSR